MENNDIKNFLQNNFDLIQVNSEVDTDSEYLKYLQKHLAVRIKFLIQTNMDKLLQILYRIDVPQSETDQAFHLGEIHQISDEIARLVISRQLKKIDYAKQFYGK